MVDEDKTAEDLRPLPPGYAPGPPTLEERVSPFHESDPMGRPLESGASAGMPRAFAEPTIRSKAPTLKGVGAARPPAIFNAPEPGGTTDPGDFAPPDGATWPDGVPAMMPPEGWDPPTDPTPHASPDVEAAGHSPEIVRRRGSVPPPDAPKVELSKSLEMDVSQLAASEVDPALPPKVAAARRRAQAPTEVMLPALDRKRKKERSDVWLLLGLLALALLILVLLGVVVAGVLQRLG